MLANKRALITGANRGLGKALLKVLINSGCQVVCIGRSKPDLDPQLNSRFAFVQADLSSAKEIQVAMQNPDIQPGFDYLFLNAGIISGLKKLALLSIDEIQSVMMVNTWANKLIIDSAMANSKFPSQVIAISSGASQFVNVGWSAYSISKSSLNMLMKAYAAEFSSTHFTALAPGLVETDMMDSLLKIEDRNTFSSLNYLHENKKSKASEVAEKIVLNLEKLRSYSSGSYVDLLDV